MLRQIPRREREKEHRFGTLGPEDTNFSLLSLNLDKSFKVFKFHLSHFVK